MKIKIPELTGAALDWAVAIADDVAWAVWRFIEHRADGRMRYSTNWAHGGPIIERESIDLQYQGGDVDVWAADIFGADCSVYGDTPLIAAMRCYVASKLGDEIEIPKELTP